MKIKEINIYSNPDAGCGGDVMDRQFAIAVLNRTFLNVNSEYSLGILTGKCIVFRTMDLITSEEQDFLIRAAHIWYYSVGRWC